ncbi:type I restriction-modification system subunit M [Sporolactobacillus sp. KGMB 08714]|uniref:type I restriction-modification system subunit M n=1 Tax=Sporolactobacillus sp. KGMB 08714 TaxID=3064704 RepID=UPI002FBE212F
MIVADIEFEKELFSVANKLRGMIAPSEYKNYVLPLIFLRYLSLKYEQRRDEINQQLINSKYSKDQIENEKILEDRTEYLKENVFYIPIKARWNYLQKNANGDKIKEIIDSAMEILESEYKELEGVLPKIFKGSNIPNEVISELIKLFSEQIFSAHDGRDVDLLGRVYEYFISNFASTEGNRGGEFFTPSSIVKLLVAMLEPTSGTVYDPACGSGGMFIQSQQLNKFRSNLKFIGQEQNELTIKMARMNGILHGIFPNIKQGDTLLNDQFPKLKAETVISNPPFNMKDWGADRISKTDQRLVGPVTNSNANYMWIQHFLYHLKDGGLAGFVIANGALTSNQIAEKSVRKYLINNDFVDCVVQLPEKMFFSTRIPSALIFLSKNRNGNFECASRTKEVLFIDASGRGSLINKKNRVFSDEEIEEIAKVYHSFKFNNDNRYVQKGFCKKINTETIIENNYKLTPTLYTGIEIKVEKEPPFKQVVGEYKAKLKQQFEESNKLQKKIIKNLDDLNLEDF